MEPDNPSYSIALRKAIKDTTPKFLTLLAKAKTSSGIDFTVEGDWLAFAKDTEKYPSMKHPSRTLEQASVTLIHDQLAALVTWFDKYLKDPLLKDGWKTKCPSNKIIFKIVPEPDNTLPGYTKFHTVYFENGAFVCSFLDIEHAMTNMSDIGNLQMERLFADIPCSLPQVDGEHPYPGLASYTIPLRKALRDTNPKIQALLLKVKKAVNVDLTVDGEWDKFALDTANHPTMKHPARSVEQAAVTFVLDYLTSVITLLEKSLKDSLIMEGFLAKCGNKRIFFRLAPEVDTSIPGYNKWHSLWFEDGQFICTFIAIDKAAVNLSDISNFKLEKIL